MWATHRHPSSLGRPHTPLAIALAVAVLLAHPSGASAGLEQVDWAVEGDGAITRDAEKQLDWLDLTRSAGLSFHEVAALLGVGGQFSGFRHATFDEVHALLTTAGWPVIASNLFSPLAYEPLTALQGLVGVTEDLGYMRVSHGITGDLLLEGSCQGVSIYVETRVNEGLARPGSMACDESAAPAAAHWLVRRTPASQFRPGRVALGDFDGDAKADVVWRHAGTGQNAVWIMNGAAISAGLLPSVPDGDWEVSAIADVDGDRKSDILWRNEPTGQNAVWLMDGLGLRAGHLLPMVTDRDWNIAGTGDFDGDGRADVLWRHRTTGLNGLWLMEGAAMRAAVLLPKVIDTAWEIAGAGDLDRDGRTDIVWRHRMTGQNAVWLMDGATLRESALLAPVPDLDWSIAGVGDFDGGGKADILWRNATTGQNALWLMDGAAMVAAALLPRLDAPWTVEATGDCDGDGKADIVWQHRASGQVALWAMDGSALKAGAYLPSVSDLQWQIQ